MNYREPLIAMALKMRQAVPRWYSLAPLYNPQGLKLIVHFETWQRVLSLCENFINQKDFQVTMEKDDWVSVKFPFPVDFSGTDCKSLQRTITTLFSTIDCVEKDTHPEQLQLVACRVLFSRNELEGYALEVYISYEMKCFLKKNTDKVEKLATTALKSAAQRFHFPKKQEDFRTFVEKDGFLYFIVGDSGGPFLGVNYKDRRYPNDPIGYVMVSDNIDSPGLQLIFLYALATVAAWGEKQ